YLATTVVAISKGNRRWPIVIACCWLVFAAWLTSVQAPIWGSKRALVSVWAIEHPNSPRAIQEQAADYYGRGLEGQAADLLLEAYERGIRGADFPAQVLLLACLSQDSQMA